MELNLSDPLWRLRNLYQCKREGDGIPRPFHPRPEQEVVLRGIYESPGQPDYIIKSRRLGMSTGIGIGMTDYCAWNGGATGRLIERTQDFAADKMRNIIRFAFDSIPKELRARFDVRHKDSQSVLDPKLIGADEKFRSEIHAGVAARGGDCSILHVSEMGPIAFRDPKRAEEIITGAFPAARKGKIIVETTWMGGKSGHLWERVKPILEKDPEARGRILFFPWHGDPECVMLDGNGVSAETEAYFKELAGKLEMRFSQEQKRWYAVTAKEQGIFMKREYPSTLAEAFSAPVEGAIYAKNVAEAFAQGRVTQLPVDGNTLVHTFWDLGAPRNTRVWYAQIIGMFINIIRIDVGTNETLVERWARMLGYGYNFGKHYLPHDAKQTERTGNTMETACREAGMQNIVVLPPCQIRGEGEWYGINHLRGMFPSLRFDSDRCSEALDHLQAYHTHPETGEPVKDGVTDHTADGGRTMAEAHAENLFTFKWADNSFLPADHPLYRDKGKRKGLRPIRLGG